MKKLSQISIFEKNPIKRAIDSVNIKSKLIEVKSDVKDISTSISNALSNPGNQTESVRIPYNFFKIFLIKKSFKLYFY